MDRTTQAEWLEWSGLPTCLNKARSGGWVVFKKLIELDCRAHRHPGAVEVSLEELGERCGLTPDVVERVLKALQRKKYVRIFIPDNPEERGLFEIRTPISTPIPPKEIAERTSDPSLRDPTQYRYAFETDEAPIDVNKVQQVVDHYLNYMSQKMNGFILEQIEIAARRFPLESILGTIERGARHDVRAMGWVLKQLIRDHAKKKKNQNQG